MKEIIYVSESIKNKIDLDTERRNVAGALIFKSLKSEENHKNQLLIIQRAKDDHWPNFWEIPRGKVEENETIKQGLLREVKEEVGIDIIPIRFFNKFNYIVQNNGIIERFTTEYNFICQMKNEEDEIKLSHEHQDFKWITYDAEAELYLNGEIKQTVMMALNDLGDFKINTGYNYDREKEILDISESVAFNGTNF